MKIAIAGAGGRMGRAIIRYIVDNDLHKEFQIMAALVKADDCLVASAVDGLDGIYYTSDSQGSIAGSDVLLDFTQPDSTMQLAKECAALGKCIVSGVTGLSSAQFATLSEYAKVAKIFWAPNMSIGIGIVAQALANIIPNLPDDFDIEILEMHHRDKIDAPSGTALYLAEQISSISDKYKINKNLDRNGSKKQNEINFGSLRGGSVIGEHVVIFAGNSETISIQHKAQSRDIFIKGALSAAKFIFEQQSGRIYNMNDILSINR